MRNNTLGNRIKTLREEKSMNQLELAKILHIGNTTLSQYESDKRVPSDTIKKKIAEYFDVSLDYLMGLTNIKNIPSKDTGNEDPESNLNKRDLKDIAKDVDSIMNKLDKGESGPAYYNDIEMKEEDKELFRSAIELALKTIKVKNKETYTPKKYRKK